MDRKKADWMRQIMQSVIDANQELFESEKARLTIMGGGTIYSGSVVYRIEIADVSKDGNVESKEAVAYRAVREAKGLPALGFRFKMKQGEFQVSGYNKRRPKMPVICTRVEDGKRFKMPILTIHAAMEKAKAKKKAS